MNARAAVLLLSAAFLLPACERDEGIAEEAQPADTVVAVPEPAAPEVVPGMEDEGPDEDER